MKGELLAEGAPEYNMSIWTAWLATVQWPWGAKQNSVGWNTLINWEKTYFVEHKGISENPTWLGVRKLIK